MDNTSRATEKSKSENRTYASKHGAKDGSGIVYAAHGKPIRQVDDVIRSEHVWRHRDREEEQRRQGHLERYYPQVDIMV
jgi:hypothetical protein